jgi:hypothetical protein
MTADEIRARQFRVVWRVAAKLGEFTLEDVNDALAAAGLPLLADGAELQQLAYLHAENPEDDRTLH